ncbi:MAG: hypothetical protein IH616_07335 [Gemmatimonadales bacterium]|nr:hypothetical protein [Gemmatimonadales bacterium]
MRRIEAAAIVALALSACSRTGTIEGDVYLIMDDGAVKRGAGTWVYVVPEAAEQALRGTVDTLCIEAAYQQQYSADTRRAQIRNRTRWFEEQADSLKQEADRLPPAERTRMTRTSEQMLSAAYDIRDRDLLALVSEGPLGRAATDRLQWRLRLAYASASVDSVKADVDGHYVLNDVPHGNYVLFAPKNTRTAEINDPLGNDPLGWRAVVEVSGGPRRQDLDNEARLHPMIVCPHGGRPAPVADSD